MTVLQPIGTVIGEGKVVREGKDEVVTPPLITLHLITPHLITLLASSAIGVVIVVCVGSLGRSLV